MKKKNRKILLNILGVVAVVTLIILTGKNLNLFAVGIGCDETAYNTATWGSDNLVYSGVTSGSTICGGESTSPKGGTILTGNHNYAGGWQGSPNFGWEKLEEDTNFIFPPQEIVTKYITQNNLADNMECRVYGNTVSFGNTYGDNFGVSIPYDIKGDKVEWQGADRGFRCKITIPSTIQEQFVQTANANGCWGHICGYIYGSTPVVSGSVIFTIKPEVITPECTNDYIKACTDEIFVTIKQCVNGRYYETGNTCPIGGDDDNQGNEVVTSNPIFLYLSIAGIIIAVVVVIFLKIKKR